MDRNLSPAARGDLIERLDEWEFDLGTKSRSLHEKSDQELLALEQNYLAQHRQRTEAQHELLTCG